MNVLRITRTESSKSLGFRLEGKLEGPWVELLRKTWADTLSGDGRRQVVVDLGDVSFVDSDGRALLLNMKKQGVGLIKASAFIRETLKLKRSDSQRQDFDEKGE